MGGEWAAISRGDLLFAQMIRVRKVHQAESDRQSVQRDGGVRPHVRRAQPLPKHDGELLQGQRQIVRGRLRRYDD